MLSMHVQLPGSSDAKLLMDNRTPGRIMANYFDALLAQGKADFDRWSPSVIPTYTDAGVHALVSACFVF